VQPDLVAYINSSDVIGECVDIFWEYRTDVSKIIEFVVKKELRVNELLDLYVGRNFIEAVKFRYMDHIHKESSYFVDTDM
jgi:hypothetical protein